MQVYYCRGWFRAKKILSEALTEEEAQRAHNTRVLHTALIGDQHRPECFVEVTGDSLGVGFLDRLIREHVSYNFVEALPGRLFLSMAVRRRYVADTDVVERGASFVFKEDGTVIVHRERFIAHVLERADITVDVTHNWEAYPQFGSYSSLIQRTRESAWGDIWQTCLESMDAT
jgi:hypothetical protein